MAAALTATVAASAPVAAAAEPVFSTILQLPGGAGGYQPEAGVIVGPNGTLFGTADRGGINDGGVVFQLLPPRSGSGPWAEKPIFHFAKFNQGGYPFGLTLAPDGSLFGVTLDGGSPKNVYPIPSGTVFHLLPPTDTVPHWVLNKLYVFYGKDDGASPSGALVLDAAGGVTGTTFQGGAGIAQGGNGIVFRLAPPIPGSFDWTETVLHRFSGPPDGAIPQAPLLAEGDTLRYGVTATGGTGVCSNTGCGTVFQLQAVLGGWSETPIYDFRGGADGSNPDGRLIADARGSLYGVASNVVYRLDPPSNAAAATWTKTNLYTFTNQADGSEPQGGLLLDSAGTLYGTTRLGGPGAGTLFSLTPAALGQPWTKTNLHSFEAGALPTGGLTWDAAGAFYGTTLGGGSGNFGTVFRYGP